MKSIGNYISHPLGQSVTILLHLWVSYETITQITKKRIKEFSDTNFNTFISV